MKTLRISMIVLCSSLWMACSDGSNDPITGSANVTTSPTIPTATTPAGVILKASSTSDFNALRDALVALPDNAIRAKGIRTALLARLDAIGKAIARGDRTEAMEHLQILRGWADGCSSSSSKPAPNDQITDCAKQLEIRGLIDALIDVVNPAPKVTINQATEQLDPTTGGPILFSVEFSEPVTGFTGSDVSFAGSTVGGTPVATVTGSGTTYEVSVTGMTGSGTVVASIPAGAATSATGFATRASTSTDNSVTFSAAPPSVTINQATGQADPTTAAPILFTVQFTESVTGFTASDVSFTGSTAGGTLAAAVTGSGSSYSVSVTGMTTTGTVVASIPAGAATDGDSNPSVASTSTDNTVTFQGAAPTTVTINQAAAQADPTSTASVVFTVVFSGPVTGFTASDIAFTGSTAAGTLVAVISGTGPTYTVTVTGMTASGTVVATIPAGAATDGASNPTAASTSTDNTVTYVKP